MSDLIRREDALAAVQLGDTTTKLQTRIANLPAVQPDAAAIRETALREAASYHELLAADEDALSAKYRGGSNPWFAHVQRASWHREHASAILALKGESHE